MLRIGVDIGGTKTEIVALDDDGRERLRRRQATPHGSYEPALDTLAGLIRDCMSSLGSDASVGIGLPGAISPQTGLVRNAYATPYNGHPLRRDLERMLGRELRFENDANCFALSEAIDGAGRGHRLVFGAILGTGAGGGIVVDGRVLHGAGSLAGEWGHNPLPWMEQDEFPGPRCYCGRAGCIEQFVSGPALSRGLQLDPAIIVTRAAAGDSVCEDAMRRYEGRLARALAHVINLLDPDLIVLGGGLSNIERLYVNVPRLWADFAYSGAVATSLVRAAHGSASGVRGAARLWDG